MPSRLSWRVRSPSRSPACFPDVRRPSSTSTSRSDFMARLHREGTGPERQVREVLSRLRIRFRSNVKKLPGTPDLLLPDYSVTLFVHGCFWHRHPRCDKAYSPKSNVAFWQAKFDSNQRRDRRVARQLRANGFRVLTVWECSLRTPEGLARVTQRLCRLTQSSLPSPRRTTLRQGPTRSSALKPEATRGLPSPTRPSRRHGPRPPLSSKISTEARKNKEQRR